MPATRPTIRSSSTIRTIPISASRARPSSPTAASSWCGRIPTIRRRRAAMSGRRSSTSPAPGSVTTSWSMKPSPATRTAAGSRRFRRAGSSSPGPISARTRSGRRFRRIGAAGRRRVPRLGRRQSVGHAGYHDPRLGQCRDRLGAVPGSGRRLGRIRHPLGRDRSVGHPRERRQQHQILGRDPARRGAGQRRLRDQLHLRGWPLERLSRRHALAGLRPRRRQRPGEAELSRPTTCRASSMRSPIWRRAGSSWSGPPTSKATLSPPPT